MRTNALDTRTRESLDRLVSVAQTDTGQGRRIASFLLAWWNADECGGFDLTDLWGLDSDLRHDALTVFAFVAFNQRYPDNVGYDSAFRLIIQIWRSHLLESHCRD